jgi:hypothetical protein
MYKHAFLIVYPSGAYGTFLDWCINYFSGQLNDGTLPFTNNGSAHKWFGTATGEITNRQTETIDWFLSNNADFFSLRSHMNYIEDYTKSAFNSLILSYQPNFRKIIIINNSIKYHLLILHNTLTKSKAADYTLLTKEIIEQYKDQFNASDSVPTWQLREMMSFWHERWHCYLRDIFQPIDDNKIVNVDIENLLVDFENYIVELMDQLELPLIHKDQLGKVKDSWLSLQKFVHLDQQCNDIVSAVVNDLSLDFSRIKLHLLDEAFIQYKLRVDHKLDLLCTGLDDFPKTSQGLKKLLVPYVDKATEVIV